MANWILAYFVLILLGLGGVAFITLLERKVLGLTQLRLGPNKVTLTGILQPVMDGVKLLSKQLFISTVSQPILFFSSPAVMLLMFITMWSYVLLWSGGLYPQNLSSSLLFFSLLGVSTYTMIMTGWCVMSSFSKLGMARGMLQSLSYEVALVLMFMSLLSLSSSLKTKQTFSTENAEMLVLWLCCWLLTILMESNRAPFDLVEGESELISGFNIEMGSIIFIFLFLSEYGMIMVLNMIVLTLFLKEYLLAAGIMSWMVLLIRSCFPRMRYDIMTSMMWQTVLSMAIMFLLLTTIIKK